VRQPGVVFKVVITFRERVFLCTAAEEPFAAEKIGRRL
jgi:hypothetical protein